MRKYRQWGKYNVLHLNFTGSEHHISDPTARETAENSPMQKTIPATALCHLYILNVIRLFISYLHSNLFYGIRDSGMLQTLSGYSIKMQHVLAHHYKSSRGASLNSHLTRCKNLRGKKGKE